MKTTWSIQTRYLVLIIVLLLLAWMVYLAHELIGVMVIAALLAYVMDPLVYLYTNRLRMRRKLAVILVYGAFLLLVIAIPAVATPGVINLVNSTELELAMLQRSIEETLAQGRILGFALPEGGLPVDFQAIFTDLLHPEQLFEVIQATTENVVWVIVIAIVTYYLLLDWEKMKSWVFRLVPEPYQGDALRLYTDLRQVWQIYLRGEVVSMLIIGIVSGIGAAAVGLPGVLIVALLAGLLGLIPSIGSTIMVGVASILALFTGSTYLPLSNFWFAVVVLSVFVAIHLFENYWLRPRILGLGLRIHHAIILVAIIGALARGGVVLALIIVPILRTVEILGRYTFRRILALDPWPEAEEKPVE